MTTPDTHLSDLFRQAEQLQNQAKDLIAQATEIHNCAVKVKQLTLAVTLKQTAPEATN